ncbi:MAG TPA: histidine kinase [Acidimicrobiales bacterium]|nr:histidine kinase [Acidimicrobiales bacterium]
MATGGFAHRAMAGISRGDIALAGLVAVIAEQEVWAPVRIGAGFSLPGPRPVLALTFLVVSLALMWRRRAPLAVLVVVTGLLDVYFLAFGSEDGLASILPVLFAFYAAGRWGRPGLFPAALALTVVHTAVHEWRDPHFTIAGPSPAFWLVLLAAGIIGLVFAGRAEEIRTASARAAELEALGEEQSREAAAEERSRIARELHDLVGHGLSLLVLQLVAATAELEQGETEKTLARLGRLEAMARNTLAETRRLVTVTGAGHADLAPQPGIADLPVLVSQVEAGGIPVVLRMDPTLAFTGVVPEGVGLTVYRLVQEALTNVIKHADLAPRVEVSVLRGAAAVEVEITNEAPAGVSARAPRTQRGDGSGHRGLVGMRERVDLYGGTLTADSAPGGGFTVRASIPVERSTAPARPR